MALTTTFTFFYPPLPYNRQSHHQHHQHHHHHRRRLLSFKLTTPPPPPTSSPSTIHSLQTFSTTISKPHLSDPLPLSPNALSDAISVHYTHLLRLSVSDADADLARAVHAFFSKFSGEDAFLVNTLIVTYLKLGLISDAHRLFHNLASPNVVSYTAIISAYAKSGREFDALELFVRMTRAGVEPNEFTFVAVLMACIRLLDSQLGAQIQCLAVKSGYCSFTYVCNVLMAMYVKFGSVDVALQVFDEMLQRDLASWNTVIAGMAKELQYERAFELLTEMQRIDGFRVDQFTLSSLLAASANGLDRMKGQEIHGHALRIGFESDLSVNNALLEFYTNCGSVKDVAALFERMPVKDVISWTSMVTGYLEFGMVDSAVKLFEQMPDRNCISYNALLAGFCQNEEGLQALELFQGMVENGMEISDFTLTSVVNACAMISEVKISKQIHGFVIKSGFGSNPWIEGALIDMCTRCGRMADAQKMFSQWSYEQNRSIVWTSMICGYARNGQPDEALAYFSMTLAEGDMILDEIALTAILGICGTLGFHEVGKQLHSYAVKSGFLCDIGLQNAIFSMYSKCGNMEEAIRWFDLMPKHDIVSWNSLITAYLLHRQGNDALDVWSKMEKTSVKLDSLTLSLVLSAFRYTSSNLVDACRSLFLSMKSVYGIEPTSEHYASMVGVLGYWGCYEEAEEMISNMPFKPDASVWRALLDSCRLRSQAKLGRMVAKQLLAIEPRDPSSYILLSNLYAASGRWNCSERVRKEMEEKGFQKHPSRSWIIHQNRVHSFYVRDRSHPETRDIYSGLDILILECIKKGYTPDTSVVLHEVEEHQKKDFLFYHSAKLALTCGLLMTRPGRPVRVVKNILLCGDCHTFFKHVSSVTGREIHIRDSSGFHCFRDGDCSCRDYW